MLLRDVDLRVGTRNDSATQKPARDNENETRHMPEKDAPLPSFTTACRLFVKGLRQHNRGAKVTRSSFFPASGRRRTRYTAFRRRLRKCAPLLDTRLQFLP